MNVYKPEIAELLLQVEKAYAKPLNSSTDFEELSIQLKYKLGMSLSSSTLKRLWGYVNDAHSPRPQTLDVLARYLGHADFKDFCMWLKHTTAYNSSFFSAKRSQYLSNAQSPASSSKSARDCWLS